MTAHPEETAPELIKTDPALKTLPVEKYGKLASENSLAKAKSALEAKKVKVFVFDKGGQALQWIKDNIPANKTIGNGHSTTLVPFDYIFNINLWKSIT
jgi:hypothetical protein